MPKHYTTKVCQEQTCGVRFTTASPQTKYCPVCREEVSKEQTIISSRKAKKWATGTIHMKEPEEENWVNREIREKRQKDF